MKARWNAFLAALQFAIRPAGADIATLLAQRGALGFVPVAGILVGLSAAAAYWLGSQLWPTSVAVVVALLLTTTIEARLPLSGLGWVLALLIEYNALIAMSTASAPLALPPYATLGLIMVAGRAASSALLVSVLASDADWRQRVTHADLMVSLVLGLAPAAVLGMPGLVGLAAAIVTRLVLTSLILPHVAVPHRDWPVITQRISVVVFYLGALASWKYV